LSIQNIIIKTERADVANLLDLGNCKMGSICCLYGFLWDFFS